ncbi:MAG TPA: DUF502 domain-containing protein [Thiothrix sp.]|nr:DUF502 domain-containing protein [Thiothrix sp.]
MRPSLFSKPFLYIRKYIIAGLIVWVPLGITIFAIKLMVDLLDRSLVLLPPSLRPEQLLGFPLPGLGIVISTLVIIVTGLVVTNLVGRKMVGIGENILDRIPLVRSIYSAVKQVTQTLVSSDKNSFRQVVLIEYPRKEIWTLAFLTGDTIPMFSELTHKTLHTVFVPTTPNPTSGVIIMLPDEDIIRVNLDVEDALKFIMSLGVVTPGSTSKKYSEVINMDLSELKKKH